jgi:uncharacterized protein (DUF697 family)
MSKDKVEKPVDAKLQAETSEPVLETTSETVEQAVIEPENREAAAKLVIDKYAKWSFGVGFIPVPAVDLVALTGLQMKMVSEIAHIYEQSFSQDKLRSTLGALIGAALPQSVGASLIKSIPVIGTALSWTTVPAASAAATYAVGTVFVKHFVSGGTFLNINLSFMSQKTKEISDKYRKNKSKESAAITEAA